MTWIRCWTRKSGALQIETEILERKSQYQKNGIFRKEALMAMSHKLNSLLKCAVFQVSYFTSISRQQEFEKSTESVTQLFSVTYFVAILFSVLTCVRFVSHSTVVLKMTSRIEDM